MKIQTAPLGPGASSDQRVLVGEDREPEQTLQAAHHSWLVPHRPQVPCSPETQGFLPTKASVPGHPKSGPASAIRMLTLVQPQGPMSAL